MTVRRPLSLLVASLLVALAAAPTASARPIDTYCSPSGDFCTGVFERQNRIKLQIDTFSFRGSYTLCVRGPSGGKQCKGFKLDKDSSIYRGKVDWARKFADRGAGRYDVTWEKFNSQLGKTLRFRR